MKRSSEIRGLQLLGFYIYMVIAISDPSLLLFGQNVKQGSDEKEEREVPRNLTK